MTGSSPQNSNEKETENSTETIVANYLNEHPGFFDDHPEILAEIDLSHKVGSAVSLIERQVKTLREQYHGTKAQLDSLIQIARENDNLNERMHRLTLAVMDAQTLNEIYVALDDNLRGDFKADAVTVKLFINPDEAGLEPDHELMQTVFVPMNDPALNDFKHILSSEKPVCGVLKPEQLKYMFGDRADAIQSTAIIPLGTDSCSSIECRFLGILAIGSHDANRFNENMGTMFLKNLGDIISRAIKAHLPLKRSHD